MKCMKLMQEQNIFIANTEVKDALVSGSIHGGLNGLHRKAKNLMKNFAFSDATKNAVNYPLFKGE